MEGEPDSFECSQEIVEPLSSNVVSLSSIGQLMPSESVVPQLVQEERFSLERLEQVLRTGYSQLKQSQHMEAIRTMSPFLKDLRRQGVSWKLRLSFLLNMACGYQGLWNLQMCDSSCQLADAEIEVILEGIDSMEEKIRLQLILLILRMQHCAIYSQVGAHDKALHTAQNNLQGLCQYLGCILQSAQQLKLRQERPMCLQRSMSFGPKIQRQQQTLQTLIADLEGTIVADSFDKRPIFYSWKNTPETNQKLMRHVFASKHTQVKEQTSRTLLGLQRDDNNWIEEFNIGSIMHMSPISLEKLSLVPSIYDQLSKKKVYEKIIYASVLHFTIATEMRFMDNQNSQSTIASMKIKSEPNYRSKMSQLSQLHHLKSIQLICKGISSKSPYLNHLINSYQKHYMQSLICINEQDSMVSQARDRRAKSREHSKDQDYFRMSAKDVLSQPNQTPISVKKIKHLKSQQMRRSSRSTQFKKRKKGNSSVQRDDSFKNLKSTYKSGVSKAKNYVQGKSLKKPTPKMGQSRKGVEGKECKVRVSACSQTQMRLITSHKSPAK